MKRLLGVFFLFLLGTSLFAKAATPATAGSLKEASITKTIQELCAYHDQIIFVGQFYLQGKDAIHLELDKTLRYREFDSFEIWERTGGLSPALYDMLNSLAFTREMKSCFPDEDERNHVVLKVIVADLAGQVTGLSQIGATIARPARIAKFLVSKIYPIYVKVLARFSKLAPVSERVFAWTLEAVSTIGTLGYILADRFHPFSLSPQELIEVQTRITLLEKRLAQLEDLVSKTRPGSEKSCAYQDVLYRYAQEYLELLPKVISSQTPEEVKRSSEIKSKAKRIESCHPPQDSEQIVPII